MNGFLWGGLLGGTAAIVVYLSICGRYKKNPALAHAIELLISSLGVSTGVKIGYMVLSGELSAAMKPGTTVLTPDDLYYFVIGGFALIWVSIDTIVKRIWNVIRD